MVLSSSIYSQDMVQIKEKVDAVNATFMKAILEDDIDTIISLYTDDCWSLPSYRPMLIGKAAIRKAGEEDAAAQMKITDFKLQTVEVMAEGDLVIEIGKYNITMSMMGMDEPMKDNGKYITVYETQSDGRLLVKIDTWNTNINPWAMMGDMKDKGDDQGMPAKDKKTEKGAKKM
jgi:uncharacterized protein (TIGR02246 family)